MNKEEIKELINSIEERLIVSQEINEPINTDLDKAIRLSVAYEELQQKNQKYKEVIDKINLIIKGIAYGGSEDYYMEKISKINELLKWVSE